MTDTPVAAMTYLPGSGWIDRPAVLEPAANGAVTCDVVVVGGGLGGMAAALRLAELGRDVVLVEADVCGWGASARNAGYVTNTVGSHPRILARFYSDRAQGLFTFANSSVRFTEELIASRGVVCDYQRTGIFAAAATAARFRHILATTKSGKRSSVATAEQAGVPPAFYGGIHIKVGGTLDPGKFALGMREAVRASSTRVFEQTPVSRVIDDGNSVTIETPRAQIHADQAILTTNAFTNRLHVAPRNLSTPVWVTAVETEPVPPERLDAAGWTSRLPITTAHVVMQSFRTTSRNTIVFTTRNLQMSRRPVAERLPDHAVVDDLVRGFRDRFSNLADVAPTRAWGGWIGMTPSNMAVAGQVTRRVHYAMACNGHGLPQAPYLGTLLADHVAGEGTHDDLRSVWRESPRFAPGVVNPATIRLGWIGDRLTDRLDRLRR